MPYPAGKLIDLAIFNASVVTSPGERPCTLADTAIMRLPSACSIRDGPLPMVMVAICSSGTILSVPETAIGKVSILSALTRSAGSRRTETSRVSPVGSTQSPTSTPANATRRACAASLAEIPKEFAKPRFNSICNSSLGSCSDKPTSTAPGTLRNFSIKSLVISINLRESSPEKRICTGLPPPLFKSSCTTYSAPTNVPTKARRLTAISAAERLRSVLLPISTYTRPPVIFTLLFVATVSGKVRAISAAFSTFKREYSKLELDGVRMLIIKVPLSDAGKKLVPPNFACKAIAATKLDKAITAIQRRWCKAHAITLP